jgi:hypothetical protein
MASIDMSNVPKDKLNRPDFLGLKAEMEGALENKNWTKAFCIHEAGHIMYLSELGATQFIYAGPRIKYNEQTDTFDGYMASVSPQSLPRFKEGDDISNFSTLVAKSYAAGGVFTKRLTNASDQGDQGDREIFDSICASVEQKARVTIDRETAWKQGQEDVAKDLRSPQFRTNAWKKAAELAKKFGF